PTAQLYLSLPDALPISPNGPGRSRQRFVQPRLRLAPGRIELESLRGSGRRSVGPVSYPCRPSPVPGSTSGPRRALCSTGEWRSRSEEHTSELQSRVDLV